MYEYTSVYNVHTSVYNVHTYIYMYTYVCVYMQCTYIHIYVYMSTQSGAPRQARTIEIELQRPGLAESSSCTPAQHSHTVKGGGKIFVMITNIKQRHYLKMEHKSNRKRNGNSKMKMKVNRKSSSAIARKRGRE